VGVRDRHEVLILHRRGILCSCTWGVDLVDKQVNRCRRYVYGVLMKDYRLHRAEILASVGQETTTSSE